MFKNIIDETVSSLTLSDVSICIVTAILVGLVIGYIHTKTGKYSKNFIITICVLPLLVQGVIMMVNGNLGTSVAVLGAFSLVRFRSIPGNSREIISIFFAMVVGLAIGVGHIIFALLITFVVSILLLLLSKSKFIDSSKNQKKLKIIIPETLDYNTIFDDIFAKYLKMIQIEKVKTINMGSMYELNYLIEFNNEKEEKNFIDELRCRNGNLSITISRYIEFSSSAEML